MRKNFLTGFVLLVFFLTLGVISNIGAEEIGNLRLLEHPSAIEARGKVADKREKDEPEYVEGEAVVKFKTGKTPEVLNAQARERAAMTTARRVIDTLILKAKGEKTPEELLDRLATTERNLSLQRTALSGQFAHAKSKGKSTAAIVEGYKSLTNVEYAEPNFIYYASKTPNDPLYAGVDDPVFGMFVEQWNLKDLGMEQAWDQTTGGDDIIVAIIDSGVGAVGEGGVEYVCYDAAGNLVSCGHPDLFAKTKNVAFKDYVYNITQNGIRFVLDDCGHGSQVASIVGAVTNNNEYLAGMAWGVKLMPVKVLFVTDEKDPEDPTDDKCGAYTSDLIEAVVWAADQNAKVLNISLGSQSYSQALADAIDYARNTKKALVVAAAGNEYLDENGNYWNPTTYPAAYPNVLAVGAIDDSRMHASYSNTGSYVDVVAYGGDALSGSDNNPRHWITGAYWKIMWTERSIIVYHWPTNGTSFATPQVAGLAALLLSVNRELEPSDLEEIMMRTAIDLGSTGRDDVFGSGLIDPQQAIDLARNWSQPTNTPTPTNTPAPTPTPTITPSPTPTGDCGINVDCDDGINYQDLRTWRRYWAEGDERAELDSRAGTNILDLLLLLENWL